MARGRRNAQRRRRLLLELRRVCGGGYAVYPAGFRSLRIERVLHVDDRCDPVAPLRLGDDRQTERRFARCLGTEHLDDAPFQQPADAKRDVRRQRTGGERFDFERFGRADPEHGTLAELLANAGEGMTKRALCGAQKWDRIMSSSQGNKPERENMRPSHRVQSYFLFLIPQNRR